jgi:hypothetical protein
MARCSRTAYLYINIKSHLCAEGINSAQVACDWLADESSARKPESLTCEVTPRPCADKTTS